MLAAKILVYMALIPCLCCDNVLKCYESSCLSLPSGESLGACKQHERSCTQYGMNRCMTIRASFMVSDRMVIQQIRNCSQAAACLMPRQICKAGNKTGNIRDCQLGCCQGDLCNNGTTFVAKETKLPKGPSGGDLSCYSCSSTTTESQSPNSNCTNPAIQRCGVSRMTKLVQDRCMTITVKAGSVTQQLRNCSDAVYCTGDNYCKTANRSSGGSLNKCSVLCCHGNLCNTEVAVSSTSHVTELLLATVSTKVNDTVESRGRSRGNDVKCLSLELILALLVVSMFY